MLIYLATPYSHPNPAVRQARFDLVNEIAARLMEAGNAVFSPISHSHPIEQFMSGDKQTWEFWQHQDLPILKVCNSIYVVQAWGWQQSVGVAGEIHTAQMNGIDVVYIDPLQYASPGSVLDLDELEWAPYDE